MNGLVLGLDIGIGSVGVGILKKDTGEIIHTNSRIFPAATAAVSYTHLTLPTILRV